MFPTDAIIIAHEETAKQLEERNDPNRPLPTVTFTDKYTLEVGNQILELEYHGPMHEPGNIFIYAPNHKVLMLIDVVFPGWIPFPPAIFQCLGREEAGWSRPAGRWKPGAG